MEFKKSKIQNERITFWEIMLLLALRRKDFEKKICCWNCLILSISGNESEAGTGSKLFQSLKRSRNKSLRFHKHWLAESRVLKNQPSGFFVLY
jgi:hypothetical protein